jgi:glycerol kinase
MAPDLASDHASKAVEQNKNSPRDRFVGAIDQGTTSTRFFIFDDKGTCVASHQTELKQLYPHPGWVNAGKQLPLDSQECSMALTDLQVDGTRPSGDC